MIDDRHEAPPPREAPEKVARARAFCTTLLEKLGAAMAVEVKESPEAIAVRPSRLIASLLRIHGNPRDMRLKKP